MKHNELGICNKRRISCNANVDMQISKIQNLSS